MPFVGEDHAHRWARQGVGQEDDPQDAGTASSSAAVLEDGAMNDQGERDQPQPIDIWTRIFGRRGQRE
jgi:hypothetical protein